MKIDILDAAARNHRSLLFICFGGNDPEDQQLAETIEAEIRELARTTFVKIDELHNLWGKTRICAGPVIVILSRAMVEDTAKCEAFVKGLGGAWQQPFFPGYCISREEPEELRKLPAASPFFDDVIVRSAERELQAILTELREYFASQQTTGPNWKEISSSLLKDWPKFLWAMICGALFRPLKWIHTASFYAAGLLAFCWWRAWYPHPLIAVAVLCGFGVSIHVHYLMPADLWPRLQRSWKLPNQLPQQSDLFKLADFIPSLIAVACIVAVMIAARHQKNWILAASWIIPGLICQRLIDRWVISVVKSKRHYAEAAANALKQPRSPHPSLDSYVMSSDLQYGLFMRTFMIYWGVAIFIGRGFLAYPAIVVAKHAGSGVIWLAVTAIGGILIPSALASGMRQFFVFVCETQGLRGAYASTLGRWLRPVTPLVKFPIEGTEKEKQDVDSFSLDERAQVVYWRELLRMPFHRFGTPMMRRWRTPADYAFISYAWRDDPGNEVSNKIASACQAARIDYFLDKRNKAAGRDSFRQSLAMNLSKSTHFFLVVSPNIALGHTVIREIDMAMMRWTFEMTPTIICVVDPDLAEGFRIDTRIPLTLRFLLTFCPQMTPAEAADPALVRYIVEVTRREGKLHDWLPLLSPGTTVGQAMRLPGIVDESLLANSKEAVRTPC